MATGAPDLLIVGGGIAGSALAYAMARQGAKVVVLESETTFRDRVRGEAIMPWGVAEAKALGLYDTLISAGALALNYWDSYQGAEKSGHRNLLTTTVPKEPLLACFHPAMQEALLSVAEPAGAAVYRGARVRGLSIRTKTELDVDLGGRSEKMTARLVVGADGRSSPVRTWAEFPVEQDRDRNLVAGVLLENVDLPDDATHVWLDTSLGYFILHFPQGGKLTRTYLCYGAGSLPRLSGPGGLTRFLENCVAGGVPAEVYANAKQTGPLATFDGASTWAPRPYQNGVALIGDAAANSDPTWGQGLSLALRDARTLAQALAVHEDWEAAGNAYAIERDRYYSVVHTVEDWQSTLVLNTGPEADALRTKVFPLWGQDRTRNPDTFISGPGERLDEAARRRFFGEE